MSGRDAQRGRVYAWEDAVVVPRDPTLICFDQAQGMVDAIWAEQGLHYPPKVERLPRQATARQADATRLRLRLPKAVSSWILLHELAHAMASEHDGRSDGHGPRFVGLYVALLVRYLRLDADELIASLRDAGIAIERHARPVFLNAP